MKHLLLILMALLTLASCKTKEKIVEVPTTKTEYVTKVDTFIQHTRDSIYRTVYTKGDTVHDVVIKTKVIDNSKTIYRDSIIVDTITKPVTVEKEVVTNKMNWVQVFFCYLGMATMFFIIIYFVKKFVNHE